MAVEPAILRDALAQLLESMGVDDVVDLTDVAESGAAPIDGALVTAGQAVGVESRVRIELPDATGSAGTGRVSWHGREETVEIHDVLAVLEMLDTYCPGRAPRASAVVTVSANSEPIRETSGPLARRSSGFEEFHQELS